MTLSIMTLSIMTLSIMTLSIMTLSIMTLSIRTLSIMDLSITVKTAMLRMTTTSIMTQNAECYIFIVMLCVIMPSVVFLNVVAPVLV